MFYFVFFLFILLLFEGGETMQVLRACANWKHHSNRKHPSQSSRCWCVFTLFLF